MKNRLKPSMIACVVACTVVGLSVTGCQLGMGQGLMTSDAELARQILAQSCQIGEWHSGGGPSNNYVQYIRHGKISKLSDARIFNFTISIRAERVYVHRLDDLDGGWVKVDASYNGNRDNLYFNKNSGAFTCSTDEWRAVHAVPQNRHFEISPLIVSATPKTTAK